MCGAPFFSPRPQARTLCRRRRCRHLPGCKTAAGIEKLLWVLRNILYQNLEMQVCSGRPPSGTHRRNLLPTLDQITILDKHR